jgi:hypothetical protein
VILDHVEVALLAAVAAERDRVGPGVEVPAVGRGCLGTVLGPRRCALMTKNALTGRFVVYTERGSPIAKSPHATESQSPSTPRAGTFNRARDSSSQMNGRPRLSLLTEAFQ